MPEKRNVFKWSLAMVGTVCGFADTAALAVLAAFYGAVYDGTVRWGIFLAVAALFAGCGIMGVVQIRRLKRGEKMLLPAAYILLTAFALWVSVCAGIEVYKYLMELPPYGLTNGRSVI